MELVTFTQSQGDVGASVPILCEVTSLPVTFWIEDGLGDFSTPFRNDRGSRTSYSCIIFFDTLLPFKFRQIHLSNIFQGNSLLCLRRPEEAGALEILD